MMLCRMAFCLSGRVVALHLDISTANAYLCNQSGIVSPFLSRLAWWILSLTDKHSITLIPAYIPTHLNVEANYLSQGQMLPEWHLHLQVAQVAFHLWDLPEFDLLASAHTTQFQYYYTLESPLPLRALGLNAFNHPWMFQVNYVFPPSTLVPLVLSMFLAEHVKGQLRHLILVVSSWMEVPWLPTPLNMVADIPWWCSIIKDFVKDVSISQALKGLPDLYLNPLATQQYVLCRQGFSSSVCWWWGPLKYLHQRSTSSVGRNGRLVCPTGCTKQCHICP